jgi:hypothetical protein
LLTELDQNAEAFPFLIAYEPRAVEVRRVVQPQDFSFDVAPSRCAKSLQSRLSLNGQTDEW